MANAIPEGWGSEAGGKKYDATRNLKGEKTFERVTVFL